MEYNFHHLQIFKSKFSRKHYHVFKMRLLSLEVKDLREDDITTHRQFIPVVIRSIPVLVTGQS